jgi:hypothetical protein
MSLDSAKGEMNLDLAAGDENVGLRRLRNRINAELQFDVTERVDETLLGSLNLDSIQIIELVSIIEEVALGDQQDGALDFPLLVTKADCLEYFDELRKIAQG